MSLCIEWKGQIGEKLTLKSHQNYNDDNNNL